MRIRTGLVAALALCAFAFQEPAPPRAADPFSPGWLLQDSNGDGIADFIRGHIVVPADATAAENAAAANIAARLGYESTGLTPPLVVTQDGAPGPHIRIGRAGAPQALETGEGGVFAVSGDLSVVGDDDGLLAVAEAYSARAPYIWRVQGEKLAALSELTGAELDGITYLKGKAGIHRAFLRGAVTEDKLKSALASPRLAQVHELVAGATNAVSDKPEAAAPPAAAAPAPAAGSAPDTPAAPLRLDLATLFTSRGLFTGAARMPLPSTLNGHLYVPAGPAGTAMANLAARMGLEAIGIALPLATPAAQATARDVRAPAVLAGDSALAKEAETKLPASSQAETPLAAGEGELRIVDDAFGRRPAILARGDERGQATALDLLSAHFPNLWEQGKQHLSVEEIRYDLHRFFSRRSGVGQAAAALYHLDRWMSGIDRSLARDLKAEVYVDVADPKLEAVVRQAVGPNADVKVAGLRAGTRCCDDLHFRAPGIPFHQSAPSFTEDIAIPWEGKRLLDAVRRAMPRIPSGQEVRLTARVSEGPEQRRKLQAQLQAMLPKGAGVTVLCAFKQGYSWLMDEIAPQLAKLPVAGLEIEFAKNVDPTGMRAMSSEARWVQELYPVDEMLARKLNLPLAKIALAEMDGPATYRVHAFNAAGKEILARDFTVTTVTQPYNGVIPRYEQVQVETGWVRLEAAGKPLLDERIQTDPEFFWDHYQNKTLPRIYEFVMRQAHGKLQPEYMPPFDTLKLDIHMSEPDYALDLDRERISSLEALQEDTFYSTGNFFSMLGDLESGRPINYTGRIIPVVHASEDGKDGRVHIEFYGKAEANPLVRLSWTNPHGQRRVQERNLPPLSGEMQPRLIQARVKAGEPGAERLLWALPADFADDRYDDWLKLEARTRSTAPSSPPRKRAASCAGSMPCMPPAPTPTTSLTHTSKKWPSNSTCRSSPTPNPSPPRRAYSRSSRCRHRPMRAPPSPK
jgi:hypothetical protein